MRYARPHVVFAPLVKGREVQYVGFVGDRVVVRIKAKDPGHEFGRSVAVSLNLRRRGEGDLLPGKGARRKWLPTFVDASRHP